MKNEEMKSTAHALDRIPGFRFRSKRPEITRTLIVRDRTRLPLIIIATSIAAGILCFAAFHYQKARLTAERRDNEKRFIAVLESSPKNPISTKKRLPPLTTATPPQKTIAIEYSNGTFRTKPRVRAATAEVNGKTVER